MKEQEINTKIAEWLELKLNSSVQMGGNDIFYTQAGIKLDFLHDRNQQKWIEERLIKDKCDFDIVYSNHYSENDSKVWMFRLWFNDEENYIEKVNKSKDQAFIDAVMELINQEEKK